MSLRTQRRSADESTGTRISSPPQVGKTRRKAGWPPAREPVTRPPPPVLSPSSSPAAQASGGTSHPPVGPAVFKEQGAQRWGGGACAFVEAMSVGSLKELGYKQRQGLKAGGSCGVTRCLGEPLLPRNTVAVAGEKVRLLISQSSSVVGTGFYLT